MSAKINGWIFDCYPNPTGVTIWIIGEDGSKYRCTHSFQPSFFLQLNSQESNRAKFLGQKCPVRVNLVPTLQKDLFSNKTLDVLRVVVENAMQFKIAVTYFEKFFPYFSIFNSDMLVEQLFLYETRLFALAFGEYEIAGDGKLNSWTLKDSPDAVEYTTPPLSILRLKNANDFVPPKYQKFLQFEISYDGYTHVLEQEDPREVIDTLNWHLFNYDPDIILTEYGDSILLPKIVQIAREHHIELLLNRDLVSDYKTSRESSFFQYGKIIHKDGAFQLRGRWHIDVDNSFTLVEAELEGLFELVRVTQLCPQHQARASIGTGLSSLQLSWGYRNGYLIPSKKREGEDFKTADLLLMSDRGGLIFTPPVGYHEEVGELDFVSMYPTIMVRYNVSPETVKCQCCDNKKVPELEYSVCEKREGIVAATLRPIIEKRAYYKKMKKKYKGKDDRLFQIYDRKQNALKWMLVSCFGYLGYKNARFGRIEAHEAVNAYSREFLLTAKEVAESRGYHLVHGIIDCIWLQKKGATESDYENLCREIADRVNIDISLEGIYSWIVFPASKTDSGIATSTRYAGCYHDGDTKLRGIETRRHDTCTCIKDMQYAILKEMTSAATITEIEQRLPRLLEIAHEYVAILKSGKANVMDLVMRRRIRKEAQDYTTNTITATVTKLLDESGVHLAPGEGIEFIIVDASGKKQPYKAKPLALYAMEDGYDIAKYIDLALDAIATLLQPFGYGVEILKKIYHISNGTNKRTRVPGSNQKTKVEAAANQENLYN